MRRQSSGSGRHDGLGGGSSLTETSPRALPSAYQLLCQPASLILRSNENEVFTVFEDESQGLGLDDKNPVQSRYRPQSHLVIVRAQNSRVVLSSRSVGSELVVAEPIELGVPPKECSKMRSSARSRGNRWKGALVLWRQQRPPRSVHV